MEKALENNLDVTEIRTLRWMCGITKPDRIRSERGITGITKVEEIAEFKWFGHVMKREEECVGEK